MTKNKAGREAHLCARSVERGVLLLACKNSEKYEMSSQCGLLGIHSYVNGRKCCGQICFLNYISSYKFRIK